jgi:hypothetical protein
MSYVDCPSSQTAGDDMCYDENVLYRHRSQENDVAPSDGVSFNDKYDIKKVGIFEGGACDPAAGKGKRGEVQDGPDVSATYRNTLERKGNQSRAFTSETVGRQSKFFQKRRHVETA